MINKESIKHKTVIILKPRLDIPFKNLGKIPKTKGPIIPIRKYYEDFRINPQYLIANPEDNVSREDLGTSDSSTECR